MPEHRNRVIHRSTVILKLESDAGREVLHPACSSVTLDRETLQGHVSGIRESIQLCVENLIEDGLLPPWN
jgi:hypothetical protein